MDDFVSWDASYDLGIEYVDKQHRRLVELINELYHACLGEKGELEEKFKHVMKELVEYVMIHFKDEEKIMEEINYPNIKEHKQHHENFVKKILENIVLKINILKNIFNKRMN